MKSTIFTALRLTMVCLAFTGIYTLVVFAVAQMAPNHGKGEIIVHEGKNHYSNIGQSFTEDKYFWSRPSAADYNAAGSAGSNKGPTNPEYLKQVQARIDTFLVHNPEIKKSEIPVDLITASGSGLDPNISVKAAQIQIGRIAKIRGIHPQALQQLITQNSEKPLLGMFGPKKVNALKLNVALDKL
jgi:K+-transporting ATPase ATPase C chain